MHLETAALAAKITQLGNGGPRQHAWGGSRMGAGRPKGRRGAIKATPATLRRLKEAGRLQCSDAEIAVYLSVDVAQLEQFLASNAAAQVVNVFILISPVFMIPSMQSVFGGHHC